MGETSILSEILQNIGLPLVTGIMGCPVLLLEERYDNDTVCEDCKLKKEVQNAEGATENR